MTKSRIGICLVAVALSCGLSKSPIQAQVPVGVQEPDFLAAGVAQYELLCWNVVIGKENLDKL